VHRVVQQVLKDSKVKQGHKEILVREVLFKEPKEQQVPKVLKVHKVKVQLFRVHKVVKGLKVM
jgi:hypothetical protein